jgi:HTH-type transcriptional regulator / antitoxin HipB
MNNYPDRDNCPWWTTMNTPLPRSGKGPAVSPDVEMIAQAIREARRRHGLTQTQLAGLSGTGLRFISELERGKPNVALNKVLVVLAVLGLRIQVGGES